MDAPTVKAADADPGHRLGRTGAAPGLLYSDS